MPDPEYPGKVIMDEPSGPLTSPTIVVTHKCNGEKLEVTQQPVTHDPNDKVGYLRALSEAMKQIQDTTNAILTEKIKATAAQPSSSG
ncbi:hypothetical protein EV182_002444 [Spiromyces aspiralis]|uniref:Uncharacterized protein n=1 Tax=Spiromyces aspiralis TaxID=68401 RepID=A0ACC1HRR4_9FUNG|nr:hypothetical protein EV182_002444 [Spiromyces aspiralis]